MTIFVQKPFSVEFRRVKLLKHSNPKDICRLLYNGITSHSTDPIKEKMAEYLKIPEGEIDDAWRFAMHQILNEDKFEE